ncbi:MAG: hypothetical protein J4N98_06355, partial [Chloroflexi bacterium]|nr:hypothetical protein [Chloroflexota bacterium]
LAMTVEYLAYDGDGDGEADACSCHRRAAGDGRWGRGRRAGVAGRLVPGRIVPGRRCAGRACSRSCGEAQRAAAVILKG